MAYAIIALARRLLAGGLAAALFGALIRSSPPARWSLSRLWIAHWKRHWSRAACLPRSRSRRPSWTVSIWPKTGSTIALRRL
jgi:hypothetical protein